MDGIHYFDEIITPTPSLTWEDVKTQGIIPAVRKTRELAIWLFRGLVKLFCKLSQYLWEKRFGVPHLIGLRLIPRLHSIYPGHMARSQMERYFAKEGNPLQPLDVLSDHSSRWDTVICYPPDYDRSDRSRALIFNNSSATIAGPLLHDAEHLAKMRQCPVICYDYRGIGMNHKQGLFSLCPSTHSVIEDAERVLHWAHRRYATVEVYGHSLGANVAAIATERFLEKRPEQAKTLQLFALDAYTRTDQVYGPRLAWVTDLLHREMGALGAASSLADRGVKITLICHDNDKMIPERARLANAPELQDRENVRIFRSKSGRHGWLGYDMEEILQFDTKSDGDTALTITSGQNSLD